MSPEARVVDGWLSCAAETTVYFEVLVLRITDQA
jgi:hypothetical protein